MHGPAAYDAIAEDYVTALRAALDDPASVVSVATRCLLDTLGPVDGLDVCDLGCGEGHLARKLAGRGAHVVGVDISRRLLALARTRAGSGAVQYVLDDAQRLGTLADGAFDRVVSALALMDMPDLHAVYAAAHRVLRAEGRFVFAITHPCFQSPGTQIETDEGGNFVGRRIRRYATEGFWRSENPAGIRGRVGAHHRTLATIINGLIRAGFTISRLVEPTLSPETHDRHDQVEVPTVLVVEAGSRKRLRCNLEGGH